MGFADAVRARVALARGESLAEAIRIFLAPKAERRRIAARKFPGQAVPTGARARTPAAAASRADPAAVLDASWYAEANGLSGAEAAAAHYGGEGLVAGLAPRPSLAGPDGRYLSPRGAEFLHRLGFPLGAPPRTRTASDGDGRDPWTIGNPEGRPVAVVTALTSDAQRLLPLQRSWAGQADFYVFTPFAFDDPGAWRPVRPVFHHPDPGQIPLFAKTHLGAFFATYDRVVWMDPGILLCAEPAEIGLLAGGPFACFRSDGRSAVAEAAALAGAGRLPADALADAIGSAARDAPVAQTAVPDTSVLVLDPSDASVATLSAAWWRHAMRLPAADPLALALAVAGTPGVRLQGLRGGTLDASPDFARMGLA